jgi:hypothetical protein
MGAKLAVETDFPRGRIGHDQVTVSRPRNSPSPCESPTGSAWILSQGHCHSLGEQGTEQKRMGRPIRPVSEKRLVRRRQTPWEYRGSPGQSRLPKTLRPKRLPTTAAGRHPVGPPWSGGPTWVSRDRWSSVAAEAANEPNDPGLVRPDRAVSDRLKPMTGQPGCFRTTALSGDRCTERRRR